jgi:hypothetical protein
MPGVATDRAHIPACARLASVLRDAVDVLRDDEPATLAALLAHLAEPAPALPGETAAVWLAGRLAAFADGNPHARTPLADLMGDAARGLATHGEPPADAAGAAVWRAALITVERLYGGGFRRLGRLPFVDDDRVAALLAESRQAAKGAPAPGQWIADPGPALHRLAVDRRLCATASEAVGRPEPT